MAKKNVGSGSGCCQEVVVVRKRSCQSSIDSKSCVAVVVMVPRPLAYMAGGQLLHWEALSSAAN